MSLGLKELEETTKEAPTEEKDPVEETTKEAPTKEEAPVEDTVEESTKEAPTKEEAPVEATAEESTEETLTEDENSLKLPFILGTKLGMTQIFSENGTVYPTTVIEVGPCSITQVKTIKKDGYSAVQIGYVDV